MEYKKLGNSDLEVSIIGFGAWGIGGAPFWDTEGEAASARALEKSYELGINFFRHGSGLRIRPIGGINW